jgi:tripartite-type tricarboxylate transporter receptor subunit TctC
MMKNWKEAITLVVMTLIGSMLTWNVLAGEYPERPVTLIVPWPAGGATDVVLRDLAQITSKYLGQTIVIDNKPGAAGTLGPAVMSKTAKPDGYTISQIAITLFRLPHMQVVNYDALKDFDYIIGLSGYTFGVVVRADSPWKTWQDFATHVKANPGKVAYGSVGAGSSQHIAMQSIGDKAGFEWTHVPFKGSSDALISLLGGHIDAVADSTGWAPHIESGKMRLLATFGAQRTKNWSSVPNLTELGYGLVFDSPYGLAGPKGMDPAIVKKLHDAFKQGLKDPAFGKTLEKFDQTERYMDTKAYGSYVKETYTQEGVMIKKLGLAQGAGSK